MDNAQLVYFIHKQFIKKFKRAPVILRTNTGLIIQFQFNTIYIELEIIKRHQVYYITYIKDFNIHGNGDDTIIEKFIYNNINDVYIFVNDVIDYLIPPSIDY